MSMWRQHRISIALSLLLLGAGCSPGGTATATPSATPSRALTPTPSPTPACVDRVFAALTEEQRVGQLMMLGLANNQLGAGELDAIRSHHIGSVWFVDRTYVGVNGIRAVTDAVQSQVSGPATGGVRFFIAANQEGGITQALHGTGFSEIPTAVAQGTLDVATLESRATTWGRELRSAGVNLNFAPVMDVVPPGTDAQNQPIGVLHREYGHDPGSAGSHGAAFLRGMRAGGIDGTLKHFPGLGRVVGNTDFTSAVVDRVTTANDPYLQSFVQGFAAGADFVMISIATYTQIDPSHLAAFSPVVIRQLLRGTLGYQGVIISDDLGATAAVANIPPAERAVDFLNAVGDMIISKTVPAADAMLSAVLARAAGDSAFRARVDDAALRILRAKDAAGLLPC